LLLFCNFFANTQLFWQPARGANTTIHYYIIRVFPFNSWPLSPCTKWVSCERVSLSPTTTYINLLTCLS
jgi:hypothetical protein